MKRRMRDNEITLEFTWKTSKEVKNHGPTTDQKYTRNNNQGVQKFFLVQYL